MRALHSLTRRTVLALAACAGLLAFANQARACSCAPPEMMLEDLDSVAVVFDGRVLSVSRTAAGVEAVFEVDKIWKGQANGQVRIGTAASSAACGVEFATGQSYTVVAREKLPGGPLVANLCGQLAAELIVKKLSGE